ncbi:hypothetical protein MPTK1_7g14510 [Marchantia polymorpha subsp. ruderalis]|uniref:RRM domain-containing protein n=3 Tax=Marchantia polymorpha TaxID=3197 RepID=A0AAF6BZK4_MARPO|nr:hypothetical protein MARPO_0009s0136 [Marchantia polymorpha]BBN17438.1 hypothetical protein Mp_7g14510 [Marchantia polymorpha subsp. ruderalis]|eukprot:PTQ47045.1 hypothetical protein MARPO_0009s0136 [Marchantia polymorpha]
MTFENESSVYVGGLAYTSTEEELQDAFDGYGEILSIKIVYDRETGQSRGFGFVTFSNPRSASKAISELDGGIIGGRTVRVNEVRKHAGMNGKMPVPFRDRDFDIRDKDRERERHRDRGERTGRGRLSPPRNRRTSPGIGRSNRGRSPLNASIGRNRGRSPDMSSSQGRSARARSPVPRRSCTPLKERSPSLDSSSAGRHRARTSATSQSPNSSEQLRQLQETPVRVPPPPPPRVVKLEKRKALSGHPESLKVREELDKAHQSRQELEEKVAQLTGAVERAEETVAALHNRSKKLEEALENSITAATNRQLLLRKMQRGILQVKDSSERLSRHEKELKMLMNTIASDIEVLEEGDVMVNGGHFDGEGKVDDDMMLLLSDKAIGMH